MWGPCGASSPALGNCAGSVPSSIGSAARGSNHGFVRRAHALPEPRIPCGLCATSADLFLSQIFEAVSSTSSDAMLRHPVALGHGVKPREPGRCGTSRLALDTVFSRSQAVTMAGPITERGHTRPPHVSLTSPGHPGSPAVPFRLPVVVSRPASLRARGGHLNRMLSPYLSHGTRGLVMQ